MAVPNENLLGSQINKEVFAQRTPEGQQIVIGDNGKRSPEWHSPRTFESPYIPNDVSKILSNGDYNAESKIPVFSKPTVYVAGNFNANSTAKGQKYYVAGDIGINRDSAGELNSGGNVTVTGDIYGATNAIGKVTASHFQAGGIDAGGDVKISGDSYAPINSGGKVNAQGVFANVVAIGDVNADEISGNIQINTSANVNIKTAYPNTVINAKGTATVGTLMEGAQIKANGDVNVNTSYGQIISKNGNVTGDAIYGDVSAKNGSVKAKSVGTNVKIDSPNLYLLEGASPPKGYTGKTQYIPKDKWESYTPQEVTKTSLLKSNIEISASNFKQEMSAAGVGFDERGSQPAVAIPVNSNKKASNQFFLT